MFIMLTIMNDRCGADLRLPPATGLLAVRMPLTQDDVLCCWFRPFGALEVFQNRML